ncbi:hypothetical protein TNCV_1703011 [Trichonephila clavipes]|nr:hypothetical protein TNCV_1703011 [Trichonephila clavipes]
MQKHDVTPTVSPIPIALSASVPPALLQLVLTPPSSGPNIIASTALFTPRGSTNGVELGQKERNKLPRGAAAKSPSCHYNRTNWTKRCSSKRTYGSSMKAETQKSSKR